MPTAGIMMRHERTPGQYQHIVFPREESRRSPIDFAPRAATSESPASIPEQQLPEEEARFLTWLFTKSGIDVRHYRTETLHRRLNACLRFLRASSPRHARQLIEHNPALLKSALSTMLVGVTSFFRDAHVFEQLRNDVLPELAEQRRGIYVWSIGCSEGAELYSMAMLMDETGVLSRSYLLGTDCREEAIDHARLGQYDESQLNQVSANRRTKYFEKVEDRWQVVPQIRRAVRWRRGNMLGELEAGLWDLILFRNTAMYLKPEAALSLWPRLEAALRPGGVLVLGRAERPNGANRLRVLGPCLYRRNRS